MYAAASSSPAVGGRDASSPPRPRRITSTPATARLALCRRLHRLAESASCLPVDPSPSLIEYLRHQRSLARQEEYLAEIALKVADGRASLSELDFANQIVDIYRSDVRTVLQKALSDGTGH